MVSYVTAQAVVLVAFFFAREEFGASVIVKLEIIFQPASETRFLPNAIILVRKQEMERTDFNFSVEMAGATAITMP